MLWAVSLDDVGFTLPYVHINCVHTACVWLLFTTHFNCLHTVYLGQLILQVCHVLGFLYRDL